MLSLRSSSRQSDARLVGLEVVCREKLAHDDLHHPLFNNLRCWQASIQACSRSVSMRAADSFIKFATRPWHAVDEVLTRHALSTESVGN